MTDPDVLIVGAGPTGAIAAKRLAEAGMSVVCLEQGGWPDYERARSAYPDYELTSGVHWAWDPNVRDGPGDYPIDDSESDITALMWNGVGGGTVVFAAHWQRNLPSDFRVKSLDGVGDDWPLSYEELEPYYVRVERDWGVSGLANDTAFPPGEGPPMPPVPLSAMGRRVAKAHNELGWHWWPGPNAIATQKYGALNPCVLRATCLWGCADGAKATVDRTYWPVNQRNGVELITRARVRRLLQRADGLIEGAEYVDADGKEHFQRAGITILGANGIGTPRLLFLSGDNGGLANSSGLVGKRLMLHPFGTVTGLFEEDLKSWQGAWGQHIHSLEFYETGEDRDHVRGAKWGLQPTGGPLSMTRAYPWGEENAVWGEGFHREVKRRLGHSAMWGIIAEDLPEESNRVTLDPSAPDEFGIPGAKIEYKNSENTERMMNFHRERARESLIAAGAYDVIIAPFIDATGWHILGTCKMGDDPASSVVDRWGRCHDIDNLFIFDGSVWPTSSGMNPTATIAAMALRCAEHLVENRRDQKDAL